MAADKSDDKPEVEGTDSSAIDDVLAEEWAERYERDVQRYTRFCDKLKILIAELLEREDVATSHIDSRIKSVPGFSEKLKRKGDQYNNPLVQMPDLVGLRVVVYYPSQRLRAGDLLDREFVVDRKQSTGEEQTQDPDRFGYESAHYVITLKDDRQKLSDWADYSDLHAEVQVRTVLQDAWGSISHKLDYKSEQEVPRNLRRQLFRLSALMELADEQFEDLRENTEALEARYERQVESGQLADVALDSASLTAYVETTRRLESLVAAATRAGFRAPDPELSPSGTTKSRSRVLRVASDLHFDSLGALDSALNVRPAHAKKILSAIVESSKAEGFVPVAHPWDVAAMLLLAGASDEIVERTGFKRELKEAISQVSASG